MTDTVKTLWKKEMTFDCQSGDHVLPIDAAKEFGGKNRGPLPRTLLLAALSGCTGMDVMSILNKMEVKPRCFDLRIEGDLSEEHPKVYTNIRLRYLFKEQEGLDKKKVERAVSLSQEKYCGMAAMIRQIAKLTWSIEYI